MMNNDCSFQYILKEAIQKYGPDYGFINEKKAIESFMQGAIVEVINMNECKAKCIAETLISLGKVLECSEDGNEIVAVLGAGVGNMNVVFVVVTVHTDSVTIAATAREGLIKQDTAKRAVERIRIALG